MIFVLFIVTVVAFTAGVLVGAICLSIKEEEMQMDEARRCWRRMEGGR